MPRTYKRKNPDFARTPPSVMRDAVRAVQNGMPEREASRTFNIPKTTLRNNILKAQRLGDDTDLRPNYLAARIFTDEQEVVIKTYIKTSAKMFHGLSIVQFRFMVFELAVANNMKVPDSWRTSQQASDDFYRGFMQRHPDLSIRIPEATSLARTSAFNRYTVGVYFDLLKGLYDKLKVSNKQIFNLDETGVTTVHKVQKIIGPKGIKQLGKVTSQEKGERVTMCCAVSASGQVVPPFYVFPRKVFKKNLMMIGAPEGSDGDANQSGWMNSEIFPKMVLHFIKHTRPSEEHPVVLTMDNHESHIDYRAIELAKENHVHILTLPPHTSNKTQPLDRTVFGPMKRFFNQGCDSWMRQHPGKPLSIYNLASLGGHAFMKAASFSNITSGFQVSGIWPMDRYVFDSDEYLPSSVTDRPDPTVTLDGPMTSDSRTSDLPVASTSGLSRNPGTSTDGVTNTPASSSLSPQVSAAPTSGNPGTSTDGVSNTPASSSPSPQVSAAPTSGDPGTSTDGAASSSSSHHFSVTPEALFGYAKAPPRKNNSRGRKRGKSMVATSTPELKKIKEAAFDKLKRQTSSTAKRNIFSATQESDSDDMSISECCLDVDIGSDNENVVELGVINVVAVDDYVLVEYGDKSKYYYVGVVTREEDDDEDIEVDFFRRKGKHFVKPLIEDKYSVHLSQIKAVLPSPSARGTTQRTKGEIVFSVDFGNLNIR